MSFNAIRETKILAKISEFTVHAQLCRLADSRYAVYTIVKYNKNLDALYQDFQELLTR